MPGMILLDLMMPRMSGMEFCEVKQTVPEWEAIPVVVLSADTRAAERAEVCRAKTCLLKPVKLRHLYDTIARVLAGRELAPAPP